MKHKRLLMFTTFLVFVMISVLCVKELFTVKDVTVVYSVTSEKVSEEVASLLEKYYDQSIFSVDTNKIAEEITANRYLKVISVTKNYPNEIVVKLTQRTEKYYYLYNGEVYYFDEEYFVVRKGDNLLENAYLTEIVFCDLDGNNADAEVSLKSIFKFPNDYNEWCDIVCEKCAKVSDSVTKIFFISTNEQGNYRVRLQMREGVVIEIRKAGEKLADKLESGIAFYQSAEEAKKIQGVIYVQIDNNGNINSNHTFNG